MPRQVTVAIECDHCNRRVEEADPTGWHHFSSSHTDWGNDSIESVESHDVCSWACYLAIVRDLVNDYDKAKPMYPTLQVDEKDHAFLTDLLTAVPV